MIFSKKTKRAAVLLGIAALFPCLCGGCGKDSPEPSAESGFFAMDTFASFSALPDGTSTDAAKEAVLALDKALDCHESDSEISRLNAAGTLSCTSPLPTIVTQTKELEARFGDAVQLSCGQLTSLWSITSDHPRVPDDAAREQAQKTVNDDAVTVSGDTVTIGGGAALDLGAVAKGYALDAVAQQWAQDGISHGIFSMHSAVLLYGQKPSGSDFSVQIQDPQSQGKVLGTVTTPACFLATAGGYERFFTADDGKQYCHILDLTTGKPVESDLTTVTVFTDNGLKADYLSTLIFLGGTAELQAHLNADDYKLVAADRDGTLYVSDGLSFMEAAS